MARKSKGQLPSGNIRIKVYDYKDENGKEHYKSFTAPTRAEAKAKAAEWKANKERAAGSVTVGDVYREYLDVNKSRFGYSTYRTYAGYVKKIDGSKFGKMQISKISSLDFQQFVNDLTEDTSVKYVKNVCSVLQRALSMKMHDRKFTLSYKPVIRKEKHIPTDTEMLRVIKMCDDPLLSIAIQFAVQGMCRRGECCAIRFEDVKDGKVYVNKSFSRDVDNVYQLNDSTKTGIVGNFDASKGLLDMISALDRKEGFIVNIRPSNITERFRALIKKSGVEPFSFHAIRHWANSHAVSAGIPPVYIEGMGRWSKGSVVRIKTYEHELAKEKQHYRDLYSAEMSTFTG